MSNVTHKNAPIAAPYGSWKSNISAQRVADKSTRISDARIFQDRIFWCETVASEKGRSAIMMHSNGQDQCILPRPLSAKSKAHEYGGAAYTIDDDRVYFVLADDQRIYRGDFSHQTFKPDALTPEGPWRYADLVVDKHHDRIICVREHHASEHHSKVRNSIVAVSVNHKDGVTVLAEGRDFYSTPRVSPDGRQLLWLCWDHPQMPWDVTELWLADLNESGLNNVRRIAGGKDESIFNPLWSPNSDIVFASDRNSWWNLYRIAAKDLLQTKPSTELLLDKKAEFATPQWVFGMSTFGFIDDNTLLATSTAEGTWQLVTIDLKPVTPIEEREKIIATEISDIQSISCENGRAVFIGASPALDSHLLEFIQATVRPLHSHEAKVDPNEISQPQAITFPTAADGDNDEAHALFYPPHNTQYYSDGELPPAIVICHGGPTGATESSLNLKIQFWTNRGFAVVDVNYRGSTGYGREYREKLYGQWGVYDVDDVCAVVDYLADKNKIDRQRCVIKGSSAGGYTVLAALAFRDTFAAGVSLYGIGDLTMLAKETHKFEARYLDKLVAPFPEQLEVYQQRSPIHAIDKINCPLLLFQGLKDKVVPPNQAEDMHKALKEKGLPVALIMYDDEAHGFRAASTIEHMLDAELQFYSKLFDFPLTTEPKNVLKIDNLDQK